jgi:predicted ATPase
MATIFVSYSHLDARWFLRGSDFDLIPWLEQALRRDGVQLWYDRGDEHGLQPGEVFQRQIEQQIDDSQAALLLLSEGFFSSEFIQKIEMPRIVGRVERGEMVVIPVLLEPCVWQDCDFIATRQIVPGKPTPLSEYTRNFAEWALGRDEILSALRKGIRKTALTPPTPPLSPAPAGELPIVQAEFRHLAEGEGVMVGREPELETLAAAWDRARNGSAQVVLATGEAGIGKTRCIAEFLSRSVGQDAYILVSKATARPPCAPYQALTEMLSPAVSKRAIPEIDAEFLAEVARIVPGLATQCQHLPAPMDLQAENARVRLRCALEAFLNGLCERAPLVLVIDDLQWTDQSSLDFLQYFLRQRSNTRVLVVASLRAEDQADRGYVRHWLSELRRAHLLTEIALKPWSEAETNRFVTAWLNIPEAPLFCRRLQSVAEGNPLYLTEILRSLSQQGLLYRDATGAVATPFDETTESYEELSIPESIADLIELRMDDLGAEACEFLKAAAVIGHQFDPEIAQEVSDLNADQRDKAVDELASTQLVVAQDLFYSFRHSIHREAVYSAIKPGERRRLHARAGYALLEVAGPSPTLAEIQALADHFYRGEVWDKALTYQLEAGLAALRLQVARTARRYLQSASRLMERKMRQAPIDMQLSCFEGLGDAEALLGQFDEARSCYETTLERGPASLQGRLQVKLADTFYRQTRFEDAVDRLKQALAAEAAQPDPAVQARAHLLRGMIHIQKGEIAQAVEETTRALAVESGIAHLLMAIVCREQGETAQAIAHCQRGIAVAEAARDLVTVAKGRTNLGVLLMDAGRFDDARQAYTLGLEMQAVIGDAYMHALTLCNLAEVHRYLGDLDQSMQLAYAGLEEYQKQKSAFGQALAHSNLGEALLEQGQPREARLEHLEVARRLLEQNDITDNLCEVLVSIAECYLAEGAYADAERVVNHTLEVADANECEGDRANALRVLGLQRQREGRRKEAEEALRRSEEALRALNQRYDLGRTRLAQAELYAASPTGLAEAGSALAEARAIFEALGAKLQLKKAQELEAIA